MMSHGRLGIHAVCAALWAWCVLLSFPLITLNVDLVEATNEYYSLGAESSLVVLSQIGGLALFLITAAAVFQLRAIQTLAHLSFAAIGILAIFVLSIAIQWHDDELKTMIGVVYTLLLLVTSLLLSSLWSMSAGDLERFLTGAAIIFCSFGVAAIAILGWPEGRSVGNIHPNGFATPLLAAFILSQFRPGWISVVIRLLSIGMIALVSSRFALIGCIAAVVAHEATLRPLSLGKTLAAIVAVSAGAAFWGDIAGVLAIDDPDRGLSSGFSGRDYYWQQSLGAIADHPFGIGFKRTVIGEEGGHNGYLKTLLEFGVPGGGLIICFFACIIAAAGLEAIATLGKDRQQHQFACARFGGLVALAFGAFFQPQLLSLGDAFAMSFLFLLFRPRAMSIFPARTDNTNEIRPEPRSFA